MQDFPAVLADAGPVPTELRAYRLIRGARAVPARARERLPELLNPSLARSELLRLRGPTQASDGRAAARAGARRGT